MIINSVFSHQWHLLTNEEVLVLFDTLPPTTITPNLEVVKALRLAKVANLELIEDRSLSSVYRIRQTDEVFQIFQPNGKTFLYDTETYEIQKELDVLVKRYYTKRPVFAIKHKSSDLVIIAHLKEPRFEAHIVNGAVKTTQWIDPMPTEPATIARLMRKMGAFYSSYVL